jgi:hypothetical protein
MLLVLSLLRWWYSDGWLQRARLVTLRLDGTVDYFSIDLLLTTLFSPFRQISSGKVDGPLGVQLRALVDKLFSRLIGAFVRSIILLIGGIVIGLQGLLGIVILIGWALVPMIPIIGVVFAVMGRPF